MMGRYSHAHQFKRARRELKFLRVRLGRVIRDMRRKIAGNDRLQQRFADLLALAVRVRFQDHRQRGSKVYALHAPEVECIGKGKARTPYEFGCKVSVASPATKPKGSQFVLHAKALHGNPFDGHTLGPVITELEQQTGIETRRIHVDKGYRGHNHKDEVPRLDQRPSSARYQTHSPRDAVASRRRTSHRPCQDRAPYGPQLSEGARGRSDQCRARRGWPQLRPPPALAGEAFASSHLARSPAM